MRIMCDAVTLPAMVPDDAATLTGSLEEGLGVHLDGCASVQSKAGTASSPFGNIWEQIDLHLMIDRYIQLLIDAAARLRVPELLGATHASALYQVPDRGGVGVVALRTSSPTLLTKCSRTPGSARS